MGADRIGELDNGYCHLRRGGGGTTDFPEPVVLRDMVFQHTDDIQRLEDPLMKCEGRVRCKADRPGVKRAVSIERAFSKVRRSKRAKRKNDERQLRLFGLVPYNLRRHTHDDSASSDSSKTF